jgi:hypothetical protein
MIERAPRHSMMSAGAGVRAHEESSLSLNIPCFPRQSPPERRIGVAILPGFVALLEGGIRTVDPGIHPGVDWRFVRGFIRVQSECVLFPEGGKSCDVYY